MYRERQQGVALVITLIFLSIITVMAVAILAVANRGRNASRESSNRIVVQQIAEIGQARAEAEILARILASTNSDLMGPEMTVSENYSTNDINFLKHEYAEDAVWLANFDSDTEASDILDSDDLEGISNLQYDARPPVFVGADRALPGETNGFRYFLDLNRNGLFEDTGYQYSTDGNGNFLFDVDGNPIFEYCVGDPQWIGVLRDPNRAHSADNPFIGRYAYLIQPVGRSLDINQIHNNAKELDNVNFMVNNLTLPFRNGFRRNEGVGPWEINLAAFLADLNPGYWVYENYNTNTAVESGVYLNLDDAFRNALHLVNRRYLPNVSFMPSYSSLFYPRGDGFFDFEDDGIDGYAIGNIAARGRAEFREDKDSAVIGWPWIGAPNNTNFYSIHDFFKGQDDPDYQDFTFLLNAASTNVSTFDRYTYYRMISQLGTESSPDKETKINLNYANEFTSLIDGEYFSETNYVSWTNSTPAFQAVAGVPGPIKFFEMTVDRLMKDELRGSMYTNLWADRSLTIWQQGGIPVTTNGSWIFTNANGLVEKVYSRRVHQLLQMTANIYTSTMESKSGEEYPYYPEVFRPLFQSFGGNLYIRGFTNDASTGLHDRLTGTAMNWLELEKYAVPSDQLLPDDTFFYEIPLIVGARKGFPTFNEFAMQTVVDASRKIELRKATLNGPVTETNMMFMLGVQNNLGVEAWYPYTNGAPNNFYPRPLRMYVNYRINTLLTNERPDLLFPPVANQATYFQFIPTNSWQGAGRTATTNQFQLPPVTNQLVLPNAVYYLNAYNTGRPGFEPVSATNRFEKDIGVFTNRWGMQVSGQLVYYLFDQNPADNEWHLVDAVTLNGLDMGMDISDTLNSADDIGDPILGDLWSIIPYGNINRGVRNQIAISAGLWGGDSSQWTSYGSLNPATGNTVIKAQNSFKNFLGILDPNIPTNDLPPLTLAHQAPFSPSKKIVTTASWQVDDPMVHYTVEDLMDGTNIVSSQVVRNQQPNQYSLASGFNLGQINDRYDPWGGKNWDPANVGANTTDLSVRDPGLWNADHYEFPTGKLPNLGWLGRVHRGTPWQTIYLKDQPTSVQSWVINGGLGVDGSMMPTNDWRLLDYFTTSISPQVSKGRMSINQTNQAAWSAVLAGVPVTTLSEFGTGEVYAEDVFMEPAVNDPRVFDIVEGIVATHSNKTYRSLGDILAVPELTTASPFLNAPYLSPNAEALKPRLLRDVDYERIPQQVLSLLSVGEPRFVVYTFAQTLIPDEVSTSAGYFKLPINYRVTSETATRTVVKVDYDRLSEDLDRTFNDPYDPQYNEPDFERPRILRESYNLLPLE